MRQGFGPVAFAAGMLFFGCVAAREPSGTGVFPFAYAGSEYYILSTSLQSGEGNVLVRRDRARPALRARDFDQDGVLDTVLVGALSLADANRVYASGIAQAVARGKHRTHVPQASYSLDLPGVSYLLQTFEAAGARPYNRFVIRSSAAPEVVLIDLDGDGTLDGQENGTMRPESYQSRYQEVLARGLAEGRVLKVGPRYRVQPAPVPAPVL